jgi:molybdate transport system substrate-binding protein
MRTFPLLVAFLAAATAALAQDLPQKIADAQPGDVRLLVSTGLKASLDPVRPALESAVGHRIVVEYGASKNLRAAIEAGQPFEVTVLTRDVIDDMIAKGRVAAGSAVDIGHVAVAVAVKGDGVPKTDAGDPAQLKALLLGAKTVRYLGVGASAPTVDKVFAKLGIADALKDRLATQTASQMAPAMAGAGHYEVLLNLNSELHPVNGWTVLSTVPPQFQVPVTETAGIGATGDEASAKVAIRFLLSPAYEAALKSSGMTR